MIFRNFPGGSVVKTLPSNAGCGQGAKIPHASWSKKKQNVKQKQHYNKFNNGLH